MYFSKVLLQGDAANLNELANLAVRDGYRMHQYLWRLFEGDAQQDRDFIFRHEDVSSLPCFYIVSAREPRDKKGLWDIKPKEYSPQLVGGDQLAFRLRANPIVTRSAGMDSKTFRHDVVMDAKNKLKSDGIPKEQWPSLPELIQDAGFKWLDVRAEKLGFAIQEGQVRVDGYRQHRLHKARQSRPIRFSTLEFNGVLTVADPGRFQQTLYEGVGPAKGFGCGLLMVKRV